MLASGYFFFIFQQAYAMQGAVFLGQGSASILLSGIPGSCSRIDVYKRQAYMLIYSTTKIKRKSERLRKWRKIIVNKDFKRNVVIVGKNN